MNIKRLKILLADDDQDDHHFFEQALEALPISAQLSRVSDGKELMNFLFLNSATLPDVLFIDINLPRKNGIECLFEIKKNQILNALPVVIFSTSNSRDRVSLLFQNGAIIYVSKPDNFTQLKEIIHHPIPIATNNMFHSSQIKYILNA